MALTPQSTLREWIVTILGRCGGRAERAVVLNRIEHDFGHLMTADNCSPVRFRPFEEKWRNRASYERAQMVRDGVLSDRSDGVWELAQ